MIKKYFKFLILVLILAFGLGVAAQAFTDTTPAKSELHPTLDVIYWADNKSSPAELRVYTRGSANWSENTTRDLPSGTRCYGLAVTPDGNKLYVGIANGASSEIRVYTLNTSGIPGSSPSATITGPYYSFVPTAAPTGMAIGGGNRLFVADQGMGRVLVFNTSDDTYVRAITSGLSGLLNLCDVAVSSTSDISYKVYVSRKVTSGRIFIYNYDTSDDTYTYDPSDDITTGMTYPTQLEVADGLLYAAVHGSLTANPDIMIYDTSDDSVEEGISAGLSGHYEWTTFDITDGGWLIFKRAYGVSASPPIMGAKLYKISTSDLSGTVEDVSNVNTNMYDGVRASHDDEVGGLSSSTKPAFQNIDLDLGSSNLPPYNIEPTSLAQLKLDETTAIALGGTTDENQIVVRFTVSDPDGDDLTPTVQYRVNSGSWSSDAVNITGPTVASGATVTMTIPDSDTFADDAYQWRVRATDGAETTAWTNFGTGDAVSEPDFLVDAPGPIAPDAFGKTAPIDAGEACCTVRLEWEAATDPDDDPEDLTYHVVVYHSGDLSTPIEEADVTADTQYDITAALTVGETYAWNVSVTDGLNIVWADGAEGNRWTFTYIDGVIDPADPYIVTTSPVDGGTANPSVPIVITFNESMLKASVESALDISGAPTGVTYSWNSTQTELTVNHDDFSPTLYTVTVGGTDLGGDSLVAGPVPNPFSFLITNNPPTDFSKTAPVDDADVCCEVTLQWEDNGDPDTGDIVTYHVVVYPEGSSTAIVDVTGIATNEYVIPISTLTPGTTYEWNVSGTDGLITVWADGAEGNRWSFNYIDGIIDPADPYIMSTVPIDGATDVAIDAGIVITFNESMIKATVESVLDITPAATGVVYSWNSTQTVLTVSHDDFVIDIPYTVTVDGTDLGGDALVSGPVPNPFSFTTGAGFVNPEIGLIYDATRGNIFWISVPYNTPYATASELIAAINTQNAEAADSGNIITSIGRWDGDVDPQVFESYDYLGLLGWSGTDFPLETGEALYLNIVADATFTLEGTHDPAFVFDLPYDAARGNIFWVSVPYNGDFTDAAAIIADINASASLPADSGALVTSIGRWNGTSNPQEFWSYDYLGLLGWSGTNFTFTPGEGYFINIISDVDNWSPSTP